MALKIRLKKPNWKPSWKLSWSSWLVRGVLAGVLAICLIFVIIFSHYYNKYAQIVDERLKQPLFANTAKIYAAPREVRPGQKLNERIIVNELRQAGYSVEGLSHPSRMGTYTEAGQEITVRPGLESYHSPDPATIYIGNGAVQSIKDQRGQSLTS